MNIFLFIAIAVLLFQLGYAIKMYFENAYYNDIIDEPLLGDFDFYLEEDITDIDYEIVQ